MTATPMGLARQPCQVHRLHRPAIERFNGTFTVERHHIHPKQFGGSDTPDNRVWVCPTGHSAIHELLRLFVKHGYVETAILRRYSFGERDLAREGYRRLLTADKVALAQAVLSEQG